MEKLTSLRTIVLLIIVCGVIGGMANYFRFDTNFRFRVFFFIKSLLIGVVAAFTVPLFLWVVRSKLLDEILNMDEDLSSTLVFIGLCLLASFFSKRFLDSLADSVLKKLREVEQKTDRIGAQSAENADKVDSLVKVESDEIETPMAQAVRRTEVFAPAAKATAAAPELSDKVAESFVRSDHKFRTVDVLSKEWNLDVSKTRDALGELEDNAIVKKLKTQDGMTYYSLTPHGRAMLEEPDG